MVAAVYNVWDGVELLERSIDNIRQCVDKVIIVYQNISNWGELDPFPVEKFSQYRLFKFDPSPRMSPMDNERQKREIGLKMALDEDCHYFIDMDCDEFYDPYQFNHEKKRVLVDNLKGIVCDTQVYFSKPTLTIGLDTTLVPAIHQIYGAYHVFNKRYPFAWIDDKIRIDPTRQLSFTDGIKRSEMVMHHYSWVRKDFEKKIRNSTARRNIERSSVLNDLLHATDGYYCHFYGKHLRECPNVFGIEWQKDNSPGTAQGLGAISAGNQNHLR